MIPSLADLLHRLFGSDREVSIRRLTLASAVLAGVALLTVSTVVVAFDSFFPGQGFTGMLEVGQVATRDIFAPVSRTYASDVLTDQRREEARNAVQPIYNQADLNVAREQSALAARILEYIDNVRRDPYASPEQRITDLQQITAVQLNTDTTIRPLTQMGEEAWALIRAEVLGLLERVMRDSIRDADLPRILERLPNQVSLRFSSSEVGIIVDVVADLIRPNQRIDTGLTDSARSTAAANIPEQSVSFQRGQLVVTAGTMLRQADLEALEQLGLVQPADQRLPDILRAILASALVIGLFGIYLHRFHERILTSQPRTLWLLVLVFCLMLAGARLSAGGEYYLFPAGVLALLYVSMAAPGVGLIGALGFAFLAGLIADNSLEFTMVVAANGIMGTLALRRPERLNSYILAGLLVSLVNVGLLAVFTLGAPTAYTNEELLYRLLFCVLNGVITAALTLVGLYLLGQTFNLPTVMRLMELSQSGQPLLQRLMREAPGTYQHSLQVANLCEQAANAVGANAALVYVAALYHDIGKVLAPLFFTENQRGDRNPHEELNDPVRSARLIIGHVTNGVGMARQHRLPSRLVDFIKEHHGTSLVKVFYQQAVIRAGDDPTLVDESLFRYPGPRPQSKETGIMMLADSCEAALRSAEIKTRDDIQMHVKRIINSYRERGELDDTGLTLGDLMKIEDIFVRLIEASVHPRINYDEAIARARLTHSTINMPAVRVERLPNDPARSSDEVAWLPPNVNTGSTERALGLPPDTDTPPDEDEDYDDDRTRAWD
ncbi:MAG: HDIG domain-containing protein [Anaerolineae bacterium]|jgi:hypothetical protein|nr:HDIG domain-containing protein [Anaerolineae bacterium]